MRYFAWLALVAVVAGGGVWFSRCQTHVSIPVNLVVPHMNVDVKEISNTHNVPIWAVNHPTGRIFTLCVCFQNAGYVGASSKDRGLSNVLCSLLDEGYKGMNNRDLKAFLLEHCIDYNVAPDADNITIIMRTIPEKMPQLFEVLTGMVTSPDCRKEDVKRIEDQIYANLSQRMHMPETLARDKRMELAYGSDHPYAFSTEEQAKRTKHWTSDQLKAYAKQMFTRKRLKITVVGAYQEDALKKHIEEFVQALPEGEAYPTSKEAQANNNGNVTTLNMPVPQTVITWGQEGLSLLDPNFYALYLINEIMGGGGGITTSRLMKEIREKNGLAYGAGCRLFAESSGLGWFGSTATQTENAQKVIDMIRALWRDAATKGFTEDELERARTYTVQAFPHGFTSTTGIAAALMRYMLVGRERNYVNVRNDFFQKVTLEEMNKVAKDVMKDKLMFVAVGSHEQGVLK